MTTGTHRFQRDEELVAACLDGDGAAWRDLHERHAPLVWAVARRAGLSEADAADCYQAAWTVALEELPRLRDPQRFGAWIGRVTRHQAMRIRRGYGIARKALPVVAKTDVDEHVPDEEIATLELRGLVAAALGRIGDRCAQLLRLLYFADPTPAYAEIADTLRMRIGSIGPTRARCLATLRKELGGTHE